MAEISVLLAFGAGVLSFLSPCVLPLIPSYLCVIGGVSSSAALEQSGGQARLAARTLAFVLGFSAVFIALSVIFAATFGLMGGVSLWINWISGAVVIVLGLNTLFGFLSFLNYEKRFHLTDRPRGFAGAFLAGAAFGAGWTPCVGPVLGGILLMAAQSGGIPRAVLYLACYSAGLGIPFVLAALFFSRFVKTSERLKRRLPLIRKISGALLVLIGVLMVTGHYQALNALAAKWQRGLTAKNQAAQELRQELQADTADTKNSQAGGTRDEIAPHAVSAEIIRAFTAAGLPVVREGVETIDFTLPLLDGTGQTLSALKGQVVFLNFWATWCGPCRVEMPSMEAVYQRLKAQGLTILAVNLGEKPQAVADFMRENKLTFAAALDQSGKTGMQYGAQAIPTTYIIDKRGLIVSRVVGSINWNQEKIIAAFEALLSE